jgi:hypothetical protein
MDGCQFAQLLVDQQPHFADKIFTAIQPNDGFLGHTAVGKFPAASGTVINYDRLENVYPDTTQEWQAVDYTTCEGTPCDPRENLITWGWTRNTYRLYRQSWATPVLCYDQEMHVSHAAEHFKQITGTVLPRVTSIITSNFIRQGAMDAAGNKWVADANMTPFTFVWQTVGTSQRYLCTSAMPTSLLTPEMLQSRVQPLEGEGYHGVNPYMGKDNLPFFNLITDLDTCWMLEHLGGSLGHGGASPTVAANWRFEQWNAASEYWRYGLAGKVGNFAVQVDPFQKRFNYVDANGPVGHPYRFQVVQPYKNGAATIGTKSNYSDDYNKALFCIDFIWHQESLELQSAENISINPMLPYARRDFTGKWGAATHDLGTDCSGRAIENYRQNKVKLFADFKLSIMPKQPKWLECIFAMRDRPCITIVTPCNVDPGYPVQDYSSAPEPCKDSDCNTQ